MPQVKLSGSVEISNVSHNPIRRTALIAIACNVNRLVLVMDMRRLQSNANTRKGAFLSLKAEAN